MVNKTTIYLVRHAQTESNATGRFQGWSDIELNEPGKTQAHLVAERLSTFPIDVVYTSPLKRTYATAEAIAEQHGITPIAFSDLMEIYYGEWEGKSRVEVAEKWPEILARMRSDPTGVVITDGESFEEFYGRSVKAFKAICASEKGRSVAVISHDGVIIAILLHLIGVGNAAWGKLEVENTSVTTVSIIDGVPHIQSVNDISHLKLNEIVRVKMPKAEVA